MTKNIQNENDKSTSIIKSLECSFIITVLKYCSSPEHPLSAAKIADYMQALTTESHSVKTIRRKLQYMCELCKGDDVILLNALVWTYGGYVEDVTLNAENSIKPQSRYYFKPLFSSSDIVMFQDSIGANRYLLPSEKNYLHSILQTLSPSTCKDAESLKNALSVESEPYSRQASNLNYLDLFGTIRTLHEAIASKQQIELIYGTYTMDEKKLRREAISFQSQNASTPYILNPYAMIWYEGHYYLLATHEEQEIPTYFRIDRIKSAKLNLGQDSKPFPRAPIPERLLKYFIINKDGTEFFDAEKYTTVHPGMIVSEKENLQDCIIECREDALPLLVDTFGSVEISGEDIQILKSNAAHPRYETHSDKSFSYYTVRLPKVQSENILEFCIQNHSFVTIVSPLNLSVTVILTLMRSALRVIDIVLPQLQDNEESVNPFITLGATFLHQAKEILNPQ